MLSFSHLDEKNARRLVRLRDNELDLAIEWNDLGDEINTRIARWCVVSSVLRQTRRLIAILERRAA